MSFIRPEARAGMKRWRDAMIGAVVTLLGVFWLLTTLGLLRALSGIIVAIGVALLWSGIQRGRFNHGAGGLGVVSLDERQITYMAPAGGGFASLDALTQVEIGPDMAGFPVWRFRSPGEVLTIPTSAEGSEALFDALAVLKDIDLQAAIRASSGKPKTPVVIWQKGH